VATEKGERRRTIYYETTPHQLRPDAFYRISIAMQQAWAETTVKPAPSRNRPLLKMVVRDLP